MNCDQYTKLADKDTKCVALRSNVLIPVAMEQMKLVLTKVTLDLFSAWLER